MPFKIVQTIENNQKLLTAVPSTWERNGTLYWPTQRNEVKLIHDENSVPKPNWKTMKCKQKREFHSAQEAETELQRMQNLSDTENDFDNPVLVPTPRPRKPKHSTHVLTTMDFNSQFADLNETYNVYSAQQNETENTTIPAPSQFHLTSSSASMSTIDNNYNTPVVISIPTIPTYSTTSAQSVTDSTSSQQLDYAVVDNKLIKDISEKQKAISEDQKQIRYQLATLQASVDLILKNMLQTIPPISTDNSNKSYILNPVNNYQELKELEEKLKNETYLLRTVEAMTFVCGSSGKSRGFDSCYKLADYFFTRDLLLKCSWTGSSRQNDEESKIALKFFYYTRKCFLMLVRKSDDQFSETECDKFLKTIIKNAKQRLNPKIMSATKHRAKKVKESTMELAQKLDQTENQKTVRNVQTSPDEIQKEQLDEHNERGPQVIQQQVEEVRRQEQEKAGQVGNQQEQEEQVGEEQEREVEQVGELQEREEEQVGEHQEREEQAAEQ